MDDRHLLNKIKQHVTRGINSGDGDVTDVRQEAFDMYYGHEHGDEREGYSQYRSREVFEMVEWAQPSLLRTFLGGAKAVEFKPTSAQDEEQARHETDVVNYWFHEGNGGVEGESGFLTLYSWTKDFLMYPNGYVKVDVSETAEEDVTHFEDVTPPQLQQLIIDNPDASFQESNARPHQYTVDQGDGTYSIGQTEIFDVVMTKQTVEKHIAVCPTPPDEIIVAHGYNKLDLDGVPFVCHRVPRTRSDLLKMGYDADDLTNLRSDEDEEWNSERTARNFYSEESIDDMDGEYDDPADEVCWLHECYMEVDVDGDGINELRKVVVAGDTILENEPTDFIPIIAASAIHIPHKHVGMSYAESVMDLQKLISTLTRQMLDNVYKQNVPQKYISESSLATDNSTMDQLLDGSSEVVVVRGDPHAGIKEEQIQSIVGELAAVVEQFKELPKMRTGVAPQLTLDPNVIKDSTLGAFVGAMDAATQRLELLVRLFAETGFTKVFQKIHYLLRNHFEDSQEVMVNGKWVGTSPSKWKKRSRVSVNVGIGFNNKQATIAVLTQVLQMQREALGSGLSDEAKIYNTLQKLIEQADVGHTDSFFTNPNSDEYEKPKPKPEPQMIVAEAQAKSLAADAKRSDAELQHTQKLDFAKLEVDREKIKSQNDKNFGELSAKLDKNATDIDKANRLVELEEAKLEAETALLLADIELKNAQRDALEAGEHSSTDEVSEARQMTTRRGNNGNEEKQPSGEGS